MERATSFGAIAQDYDRLRPGPPAAALDWLVPPDCRVAVDLAAGTGLFTRALIGRVPEVVAVEPDPRMRAVLAERSPDVRVLDGRGEEIPLTDGSVDAVFVSSAWHWFEHSRAVPEIARVLRPGGTLGVIWTSRDRRVDWLRELDRMRDEQVVTSAELEQRLRQGVHHLLPETDLFGAAEQASFTFTRGMPLNDVVEWLGTYSQVIVADADERATHLARARANLAARFGDTQPIEVPVRSECWRAVRV